MKAFTILSALLALVFTNGVLSAQTTYDLFIKDFGQALKFENEAGIQKAIKSRPEDAALHFEFVTRSWIGERNVEENRKVMDLMKAKFKAAFEGIDTLDKIESYYSTMDQDKLKMIDEARSNTTKLYNEWVKYNKVRDREAILELIEQGMQLGRRCEEIGHQLHAAKVYGLIASFVNTIPNKSTRDTRDMMDIVGMFVRCRQAWNFTKDPYYLSWAGWLKRIALEVKDEEVSAENRKKAGLDDDADGVGKFVDTKAPTLKSPLEFAALKELPEDSFFMGGSVPANWINTRIEGAPAKMDWFKKQDLFLVRTSSTKIGVALTNAAGADVQAVKVASRIKPSLFYLDKEKKRPYCMAFFVGGEQEPFASAVSNMAPTQDVFTVRYRSASSWTGNLGGTPVVFFDDNCDGQLFTPDPLDFGYLTRVLGTGPEKDVPVACYDSMKIGKKGKVAPFSTCAKIGDAWYQLVANDDGQAVEAKPLHPDHFKTGTVQMKWRGSKVVKPQVLIIRGTGNLLYAAFNIAGGKPVEVPEGDYEIAFGRSTQGKGARTQMAHISRGVSESIKVEAGKPTVIKLGSPFKFEFVRGGTGDEVVVDSLFFSVVGAYGEAYSKIQGPIPAPEVVVAKTSAGRGAKVVGSYLPITSPDTLNTAAATLDAALKSSNLRGMGVEVGYFPVVKGDRDASTVLTFKSPIAGGLVGLRLKKHKMFGKIGSVFK
ncbi:MAG: hypothetical protein VX951_07780 [Planctomycetota bacterium]|nr:hypothetical protein [Planctomycetota bacterium]